ncbi:DUF1190 domain-containing protein [Casimicrobium huifangae]|jgi:uncharacterized protein YgiB involved in biofilm formation|uniref:DUF1190 domain-containing protein n=1 Tax=Casimicrobium huifangae TaxID=2591109 RepID=UPI0012EB1F39|nr:DUF1190 domain-containing protein [Casimicrobium huifangae]
MISLFNTKAVVLAVGAATLALAGCDQATPPRAMPNTPPAAVAQASATGVSAAAQAPTMQNGTEAIKACIANGLSEATCAQVYHDMMAGRPPQGAATFAECEAKYGVGQCGSNPVPTASGTGSVFLPLVAGAALGALGGYLLSKNLAPKGAYVPPTDWLKNRPSISAPQNPVAGAAVGGARSTSAYAQAPGSYNTNAPKVAGVDAKTAQFGTPGGAKSSVAPPPVSQPGSAYSPQAPAANAPRYGSGNYAYKAPQTSRPGARNLGRRR